MQRMPCVDISIHENWDKKYPERHFYVNDTEQVPSWQVPYHTSVEGTQGDQHDRSAALVENRYITLLSLIDAVYPPLLCTLCDSIAQNQQQHRQHYQDEHPTTPRYLCLHPHCDRRFRSRGALRFHLARSHLVRPSSPAQQEPAFLHYTTIPRAGTFSPRSRSPELSTRRSPPISPFSPSPPLMTTSPSQRVSASFRVHAGAGRAPRGSKKIVLSLASEALLNSVYDPLQCPACFQVFNRKTNVIKHLAEVHHGEEPYRCVFPECLHPRLYATREGLVYHILRAHDSEPADNSSSCSDAPFVPDEEDSMMIKKDERKPRRTLSLSSSDPSVTTLSRTSTTAVHCGHHPESRQKTSVY